MFSKNIGYHTRLYSDNTVKVSGGSFGGEVSPETVQRLVNAHFTVTVRQSGRAVFVDRSGREVSLYVSIDPETTEQGKAALKHWKDEKEKRAREESEKQEREQEEIEVLLAGLSHDEIVKRLKG